MTPSTVQRTRRSLAAAVRLGWALNSNWTSPAVFLLYTALRPVCGALMLVLMYRAITGNAVSTPYLAFLVVGTAFWSFVQESLGGFADSVNEDRGRYHMLKYIYLAVPRFGVYLVGRCLAHLMVSTVSVLVVLVIAIPLLQLPIPLWSIDLPLLLVAMALATVMVLALAISVGLLLLALRDSYGYGELLAQMLYIVSGAIFPLAVLPGALQAVAALLPTSYWLELVRRALLGAQAVRLYPGLSDAAVVGRMALATLGFAVLGQVLFLYADRRARRLGLIDMETQF